MLNQLSQIQTPTQSRLDHRSRYEIGYTFAALTTDTLLVHKRLHDQSIFHRDPCTFLLETREEHIYGFLAFDLASIGDEALDKLPKGTPSTLQQDREKAPRSVMST